MKNRNERVYAVVRRIPRGYVATYGQIAAIAGLGRMARQVGYALYGLPNNTTIPWHRVINARGEISCRRELGPEFEQRVRLELEGVQFDGRGRVSLQRFGWHPRRSAKKKR
ncbi:MAG: MGMT family protein [Gammaproteobacteria bacterium]|nr:MGMT family protein [Gammaproteobacteria bacterium]